MTGSSCRGRSAPVFSPRSSDRRAKGRSPLGRPAPPRPLPARSAPPRLSRPPLPRDAPPRAAPPPRIPGRRSELESASPVRPPKEPASRSERPRPAPPAAPPAAPPVGRAPPERPPAPRGPGREAPPLEPARGDPPRPAPPRSGLPESPPRRGRSSAIGVPFEWLNERRPPSNGWPPSKEVRRCPTLPQGPPCSTIGAEGLSFRVRNVTGRFPFAMAAETLLICVRKRFEKRSFRP